MSATKNFILASGSPQRKMLLEQIGYAPKAIIPADIDETPKKGEKPAIYVKRMALEKAKAVAASHPGEVVLAADTVVVAGTRIIQKAHDAEEQAKVIKLLSGKAHRVLTAVCVIGAKGQTSLKLNANRVIVKRMSEPEIKEYIATNDWQGASGYKIEGFAAAYCQKIIGSYSGIVGLPLYEARNMLQGAGVV